MTGPHSRPNSSLDFDWLEGARLGHRQLLAATALQNPVLQTWIARGFVKIDAQQPGTGNRRRYSPLEAIRIMLLNNLVLQGVSVSHAAWIANDQENTERQILWNFEDVSPTLHDEASGSSHHRRDLLVFRRRPRIPGVSIVVMPPRTLPEYEARGINYEDFGTGSYTDPHFDAAKFPVADLFQGPAIVVPVRAIVNAAVKAITAIEQRDVGA